MKQKGVLNMACYCLGRTSMQWFDFIIKNQPFKPEQVNFWKPYEEEFKALDVGGKMLFYDSFHQKFVGVGIYNGTSSLHTVSDAWKIYNTRNGAESFDSFIKLLGYTKTFSEIKENDKICCIELEEIKEFETPLEYAYSGQQMFKVLDKDPILPDLKSLKTK